MSSMFDDILSRAEKLSSANFHATLADSAVAKKNASGLFEGNAVQENRYSGTTFDNDLNSVFRASEHLWKKNAATAPIQKSFLFGEKGVVFGVSAPTLKETQILPKPSDDLEPDMDLERVRLESDRSFFNHVLLSRPQPSMTLPAKQMSKVPVVARHPTVLATSSSRRDLVFAEKIRKYLRSKKRKDLNQLLSDAAKESGTDGALAGVWAEVTALLDQKIPADRDDATTISLLIEKACLYLQRLFVEHMDVQVERNLERAQRGGVPGTRGLVEAFLKIGADDPFAEDGTVDGLPVWELTYHCLRAGDLAAAKGALELLANFPQAAVLVACLNHLSKEEKLDVELKKKLKAEWRHNMNSVKDKYKRALYAALLGLDSNLSDSLENWLWFKLFVLKIDPHMSPILYSEVQKNVSIDYGESYFMAGGKSEFHYYFTALWLSGQFERAIKLLFDCGHVSDAVHVGILAYEMGYLRNTADAAADMLVVDTTQMTKCSCNIARLLVSYTKEFELDDVARALDYWSLLKGLKTPSGSDVFEMAVSRAVYLTGQADTIIGTFGSDGKRSPGLIDEYIEDPSDIICRVAHDTELGGDATQAVRLYMLANTPLKAVELLCSELSDAIRVNRTRMSELRQLAEDFVSVQTELRASVLSTLCILLDVREVIPDLCLHLMRCMVDAIRSATNPTASYVKQVKAIVVYAATVNYKFPQHITSKLLQLQATVAV
ncbi:nucleoporin interacting component [Ancylostoma ceylanicum]|uniref:Nuclear pore protein n=1 Tax=Ancylostoma ceylanicum TaxID=53326 RepID=A0A0D6M3M0_9BILA|nr:nucleoporin interacting component [Ancylostoma ceylanicum]